MCSVSEQLKKYGLAIRENDDPNRYEVDFTVEDGEDSVAWVWGPGLSKYQELAPDFECNHPYQCIDFGDGEERGECLLCGSWCDYHYEEDDEGHKVPEPHEWYPRRDAGGLIGKYLEELREKK